MWNISFYGSKSFEGVGAGCLITRPLGKITFISCGLEFRCTNDTIEYETLIQGPKKCIGLGAQTLKVFSDFEITVKQIRDTI